MCDSKQKLKHEIQSLGLALVIELYGFQVGLSQLPELFCLLIVSVPDVC